MKLLAAAVVALLIPLTAQAGDLEGADAAADRGEFEAAIQLYSRAIANGESGDDGIGAVYYARGLTHGRLNQNDQALADYRTAVQTGYQDARVHSSMCYTLSDRLGRPDEALPACNEALRIDPYHAPTYSIRALIWWRKDIIVEAEKDFAHALSLDGENWGIHFNRGTMFHDLGRYPEAEADFRRFSELAPDWAKQQMAHRLQEYGITN